MPLVEEKRIGLDEVMANGLIERDDLCAGRGGAVPHETLTEADSLSY